MKSDNVIGSIRLLMAPINLLWVVLWTMIGGGVILVFAHSIAFFGVPPEVLILIVVGYLLLLLYVKLVCEVSIALAPNDVVGLLKEAGFHQKADGSMVRRFMGIPSDKVRILPDGDGCCLRGSRQLLFKAVKGLRRVM